MIRIYLDNNATTPIHPEVLAILTDALRDVFGNASSIHKEGQTARRLIEDARESVAALLGVSAREIVFTSGGTESNNAAIFGAVDSSVSQHIVTTTIEHPSVLEPVAAFEARGVAVTRVGPDRNGVVPAEAVIEAIRPETRLVAMMLANNETGVVQPVGEVARVCRERGIHLHCDAVQAAGKIDVDAKSLGVDTLSLGAHKMHAPKGVGALYVRSGLTLHRYLLGGAQERRRRAGTENVPLAAAFGAAARLAAQTEHKIEMRRLRDRFEGDLLQHFAGAITINGSAAERLPNTSNVTFHGVDAEGLVIALDLNGVAVSTGSACSSGRIEPSGMLLAMGLSPEDARSTVRFSLSRLTTEEEIDRAARLVMELAPRARRQEMFSERGC